MSEFADMAIDEMWAAEGNRQDYRMGFISEEEAYEMGILDEYCTELSDPRYTKKTYSGPGKCPKCKGPTTLKTGKYGDFYGCSKFPKCNGSRNK